MSAIRFVGLRRYFPVPTYGPRSAQLIGCCFQFLFSVIGAERFTPVSSVSLLVAVLLLTIRRSVSINQPLLHCSQSIPDSRVVGDQALAAATDGVELKLECSIQGEPTQVLVVEATWT